MAYIYLISEGRAGPVKVGVSDTPALRRKQLQTGNPRPVAIVAAWPLSRQRALQIESGVLSELAAYAMQGEWLDVDEFGCRWLIDDRINGVVRK